MPKGSSPWWRSTIAAVLAVLLVVVAGALGVWALTSDSSLDESSGDYGVAQRNLELVDSSRPSDALPDLGVEARPDRPLPTLVLYPTDGGSDEVATGPFPLVMFSHGSGGNPDAYAPLLEPLARAGYVVALPEFPLTSVSGSPVDDARNQPADVSYVLGQLLDLSADDASWLGGRIDPDRIAAAGHSLGAVTTVALTYDACCIDPRIKAAVAISGVAVESGAGSLADRPPTPLLLIHGAQDETVPISGSDNLFDAATGPAYYLRLDEADHVGFAFGEDGELTRQAVRAFLDAELRDDPAGLAAMPEVVAASGRGDWRSRNT